MTVMTLFSLALILQVMLSVRRAHIRVEYSVSWLTAAVILLIVSLNHGFVYWLSGLLGVDYPPVAILMIVSCVFLVVFYRFSIRISALKDANIALAQRVAILEYHLKSLNEQQQETTAR
jgi:hypothetical protein